MNPLNAVQEVGSVQPLLLSTVKGRIKTSMETNYGKMKTLLKIKTGCLAQRLHLLGYLLLNSTAVSQIGKPLATSHQKQANH